jgi:DNA-binding response OmpR family regulator
MKLLIIDDCPEIVEILSVAIELSGHKADKAYDGIEAVEHLQNNSYDVVITDAAMPRMGGVEVCKLLKSKFPHISIIGMSGSFQSLQELKTAGADFCLSKPFKIHELEGALENLSHPSSLNFDSCKGMSGRRLLSGRALACGCP